MSGFGAEMSRNFLKFYQVQKSESELGESVKYVKKPESEWIFGVEEVTPWSQESESIKLESRSRSRKRSRNLDS